LLQCSKLILCGVGNIRTNSLFWIWFEGPQHERKIRALAGFKEHVFTGTPVSRLILTIVQSVRLNDIWVEEFSAGSW
jgi:hypothetical protein